MLARGRDLAVVSELFVTMDNHMIVNRFWSTEEPKAIDLLVKCENQGQYDEIIVEQEGGSSPHYVKQYLGDLIKNRIRLVKPKESKYNRARTLVIGMNQGQVLINKKCNYDKFKMELIGLEPLSKVSPNFVDSVTIAWQYIRPQVISNHSKIQLFKLNW